ncbi:MAG: deoxyguanosine kinase [Candidatus Hepatoplasma scabrum]|nr:MAG: deoxyguanosine kinase [Candidatus Hepatoplasma sp.]
MRIVISGTVGVGKSTVSELLFKELQKTNYLNLLKEETVKSIYLDYYYKNPQEWAFISQLDFLLGRFKQWLLDEKRREQFLDRNKNYITIYDRHFLDDYVFAELHTIKENISNMNSITYQAIYKELIDKMNFLEARPNYFFLLTANFDEIIKRFKNRNRSVEKSVDLNYWKDLYHNYYQRPMIQNHFKRNVENFIIIDTLNKSPEQVKDEILSHIKIQ